MAVHTKGGDRSELFGLLSNHRRRYAWHHCKHVDDRVTLSDLAEQVAAWEYEKSVAELTSAERKRVYTSLQQTHLPALDDAGIVSFEDGAVELTEHAREVDVYLDIVPENDIPWNEYYVGLAGLAGGLLLVVWLTNATGFVSGLGWATIVTLAFALSALAHLYLDRGVHLGSDGRPPELD
jgi:hypothetical protein